MATEPNEASGNLKTEALLKTVIASYIFVALGVILIVCGSLYVKNEGWRSISIALGSTIIPAFLLSIFYEHFGRELLMREFSSNVRGLIQEEHANIRVKESGIVDFGPRPYRDEIVPMFAGAKESIWICKTWIPSGDMIFVKEGLQRALRLNPTLEVKILCLDPTSPLAAQRFRDSRALNSFATTPSPERGGEMITEGLAQIMNFCREGGFYRRVQIKVYRNLPAISLYATEQTALIGWYWMGTESLDGPVLVVEGKQKSTLNQQARSNFEKMWEQASDYVQDIENNLIFNLPSILPPEKLIEKLATKKTPAELKQLRDDWPQIEQYGHQILRRIKNDGYCLVKNFPFLEYGAETQKNLFLMLVCACGTPSDHMPGQDKYICKVEPKNVNRLIETYSEHDREAPLHTDSHYRETPEEFVAFLMEKQSESGGRNILLKASWVLTEMKRTDEGRYWLNYLKKTQLPSAEPSRYSETPGEKPRVRKAYVINESETMIRFREDTIRKGLQLENPLSEEHEKALKFLGELIYRSPERRGVTLKNGEILFINNYTVLHARTAFQGLSRVLLRIRFNA